MLNILNGEVHYGSFTAFSNFSMTAAKGEMVSIIGPSGCGKTSLLLAIAGLIPMNRGAITFSDNPAGIRLIPAGISLMFQQDRLLPWKRIIDNTLLGLQNDKREAALELLNTFGLSSHAEKYPSQLSGGERQRAALVRSLVRRPSLLLLDEPLAALDEQTREKLQDEIKAYIHKHSITMILVTHSIQEAIFMGSKIIVMSRKGVASTTENPHHANSELRRLDAFFMLEKQLRKKLEASSEGME